MNKKMHELPDELDKLWNEAEVTGEKILVGDIVICDICNADFTDSHESGGFLFGSYAYCPECAERSMAQILNFKEEHCIRARCPEGISFGDFIRADRGPESYIRITTRGK